MVNKRIRRVLELAEEEMLDLNHPYVGTEHLLLSLLKCDKTKKILNKYDLTYEKFKSALIKIVGKSNIKSEYVLYTPLLKLIINKTMEEKDATEVTLLKELLSSDDGIAIRIMLELNIDIDYLYNELMDTTNYLNEIGHKIEIEEEYELIGREKELNTIIEILLRKNKNNPVLVGEAGVGKTAIVNELAKRIKEDKVPPKLKNYEIYKLDMATLLSNTKYRGEFETKINNLIKEIINKENIILFIDEIHTIMRHGTEETSCDLANILKPYLATNKIKLIGATTNQEYEEYIAKDTAMVRRLSKVYINEPNKIETLNILKKVKKSYEKYHELNIEDNILEKIIEYTDKYVTSNKNPDKSLEILDCLLSKINLKKYETIEKNKFNEFLKNKNYKEALNIRIKESDTNITEEDIISVIEELTNIRLLNLKDYKELCDYLDENIYGQNLNRLKDILKKKFLTNEILSFEIKGHNGVGKLYTAKKIGEFLKYNIIYIDLKEYTSSTSINRLIGSDPGYIGYGEMSILDKIKYNPYSLIILDNIEFASFNIINLFNSIKEKGYYIDKKNNKINFNSTMIISINNKINTKIGYIEEDKISNEVFFDYISKEEILRYLKHKNIKKEYFHNLENIKTFEDLHFKLSEVLMNS